MRRTVLLLASVLALTVAGCTSGGRNPSPSPVPSTQTVTSTRTSAPASPIVAGPTTASKASACPLLGKDEAAGDVGMRLDRITVLESGGKTIGCRFYALQNSPLATSEHLPGPNQPVISIVTERYADATGAHNAMARLADAGTNGQTVTVAHGLVGVAYQDNFYPADHGKDWTCAFAKGTTLVVVKTVVTSPSINAVAVATAVAGKMA